MKTDYECKKCGYKWKSRVEKPSACPRCKRYDYDIEEKEIHNRILREVKKNDN
jgi:predicted Zn-ribbon and HTH transcriptional regulator